MFLIELNYIKSLEDVDKALSAHIEFLKRYSTLGKIILTGRKDPRTGGLMLIRVDSRTELDGILNEDPFRMSGVADYRVTEFIPSVLAPELEFLRNS